MALPLAAALAWLGWSAATGPRSVPPVALTTIAGTRIDLGVRRGKPLLVNFWATNCKTCIKELPQLMALHRDLSEQGFAVIGIAMPYDRPDFVLRMTEDLGIPYPVALDLTGKAVRAFGHVSVTPTSFLIDPAGRIDRTIVGEVNTEAVRARVRDWLKS
ncbi:MAG: TlpA disulfide reductase family protein [Chromatiales bacterium]